MSKVYLIALIGLLLGNISYSQNALNFDGIDDHIITTNAGPQATDARTVEVWARTTFSGSQRVMVDWGDMALGHRFTLNMINGIPRIEIGGSGMNGVTSIADGNWHHIAAVYNPNASASNYLLYVDGQIDNSGPLATLINTSSINPVIIGRRNDGVNYWQGDLDEIRIWNTARTPTEIAANYQQEICTVPPELWYYYKCNQGIAGGSNSADSILLDQSILGNNGSLMNFALNGNASNWINGQNLSTGTSSSISVNTCGSYTSPSGNYTWTTSGNYMDTIMNASGCDSIISIALTIAPNSSASISPMSCGVYTSPSGSLITTSGVYTDTINNSNGCDSIITINLTVTYIDNSVNLIGGTTAMANQNLATYQWLDCENGTYQILNGETSQTFNALQPGLYAVEITLNNCVDTSSCVPLLIEGIDESIANPISIYPNPIRETLNLSLNQSLVKPGIFKIYDTRGLEYYSTFIEHEKTSINLGSLPAGIYFFEFKSGAILKRGKLIKQ